MQLPIYAPRHECASLPAIKYYNEHAAASANELIGGIPQPLLPANAFHATARPTMVRATIMFRNSGNAHASARRSDTGDGVDHCVYIPRSVFLSAIAGGRSVDEGVPISCYIARAQINSASVTCAQPYSVGCVRLETRPGVPRGLASILTPAVETAQEWVNHLGNRACLVDVMPSGSDTTAMMGVWFSRGREINLDHYAPPYLCTALAHAYATTAVYENPYIKSQSTGMVYSSDRAPGLFNFQTQKIGIHPPEQTIAVEEEKRPCDLYEFVDRLDRRIRVAKGESNTQMRVASTVSLPNFQAGWQRASSYIEPLRRSLIDLSQGEGPEQPFMRLRVVTFGDGKSITDAVNPANALFSIRVDLDVLVFSQAPS